MNPGFIKVISAKPEDRRDLFLATSNRLGTPIQNIEKDFWVTWIIDLLFNGHQCCIVVQSTAFIAVGEF